MKKQLSLGTVIVIVLIAVLLTFQATLLFSQLSFDKKYDALLDNLALYRPLLEVAETYGQYYLGELDASMLQKYMIYGFVAGTGDKYAFYLTSEEYNSFFSDFAGNSAGLGVMTYWDTTTAALYALQVLPDSPAELAGLQNGDIILKVDGVDVTVENQSTILSGENGTVAALELKRGSETHSISVTRGPFRVTTVFPRINADGVGIIRITEFDLNTGNDIKVVFEDFKNQGVEKIILDLRENTGGSADAVHQVADMLLPEGPITHQRDSENNKTTFYSDAEKYDFKIAVLVNGNSASASENLAAALKDYAKEGLVDAKIIGTQTYGKGTTLTSFPLPSGGAIVISTHYFDPPFSSNFEGVGVTPDLIIPLDDALQNKHVYILTDAEDNQLQAALAYLAA